MRLLTKFAPAETLFILDGAAAPLKELLKYTLMDLFLKQALVMQETQNQPNPRDPVQTYQYVVRGRNFLQVNGHRKHEDVFMSPFSNNPDTKILFKQLIKIAYQKIRIQKRYHLLLLRNPLVKENFKHSILQLLFGGFSYTPEGIQTKKKIEIEITELEKSIATYVNTDKQKALEILKEIGGNIFLLKGLDFALLQKIDKELFEEISKSNMDNSSGCAVIIGGGCWGGFDGYSDSFDSSCSSDTGGDGSSGCGGDGGGSGCSSGCGGGGCGGD